MLATWSYKPRDTFIQRLDPRARIIAMFTLTFATAMVWDLRLALVPFAITLLALYLARLGWREVRRFVLVVSFIGGFQSFGLIYVMTQGGPVNSTNVYVYYLWQTAFSSAKMGYASAMSWILTLIMVGATYLQVRLSRKWVHY